MARQLYSNSRGQHGYRLPHNYRLITHIIDWTRASQHGYDQAAGERGASRPARHREVVEETREERGVGELQVRVAREQVVNGLLAGHKQQGGHYKQSH